MQQHTSLEFLRIGPLGENVYALRSKACSILVDPGDEPEKILQFLAKKEFIPDIVVLTHGHLDHTAALPDLLAAWKDRKIPVAIHRADAAYLGVQGRATNHALFKALHAEGFFLDFWRAMPEADLLLEEGMRIPDSDIIVLHTPGHSAGSICLYAQDAGILISGDTLFRDGVGRTDTPDADAAALEQSLRRLALLPPETAVFPGHGPRSTIGRELSGLR